MKYRTDFVTNSSSSSFIIAYRNKFSFDEETLKKYPFLGNYSNLIENILFTFESDETWSGTSKGTVYRTKEEFDEMFLEYFGYFECDSLEKIFEREPELKENIYDKCVDALSNGFNILYKSVDYSDKIFESIIENMSQTGDVILIDCD